MIVEELFATLGLKPDKGSFEKGEKLLENVKHAFEFFAGYEALKMIGELVKSTAEAADHAVKAAQKLGVTTDAIQELGYAATLADVGQESLEIALGKLAKNLDEVAQKGEGPAADALRRLGISMTEIKGKSIADDLGIIAEKFKKMPDGVAKTALAMELFGKAGKDMIPLLNEGKEGLAELRREAEEIGVVIDGPTAKAFEKWNDDQRRIHAALDGLRNQAVKALLPVLQDMVQGILSWVKANKEIIAQGIKGLVQALILVFKGLAFVIRGAALAFAFFSKHGEEAEAVLIALAAVIGMVAGEAVAAWIAAAAPIVLLVAAIAGIILAVKAVIRHFEGIKDAIRKWFRNAADDIDQLGMSIKNGLQSAFEYVANLPVIKQLLYLVNKLDELVGTPKGAQAAHQALAGTAGGVANDFFNNHPFLAALTGGSGEAVRRQFNEEIGATVTMPRASGFQEGVAYERNVDISGNTTYIQVTAPGANEEVAQKIHDTVKGFWDGQMRDAHAATGGADQK